MPNWCYNSLTIEGSKELIADVKRMLNRPFVQKHDSWNQTTGKMEMSEIMYSNPVFAFHNIYNHIQDGVSEEEYLKQPDHKQPLAEALEFKGNHWYDWNVRNWGTKWDVAVSHDEKYPETTMEQHDTGIIYSFNTAWSPPIPAVLALSSQYPELVFYLFYQEETGWGGDTKIMNGAILSEQSYENQCRDCDSVDCLEYCENDCGEICNECHYLGEADLDAVSECEIHKDYLNEDHVPAYRL